MKKKVVLITSIIMILLLASACSKDNNQEKEVYKKEKEVKELVQPVNITFDEEVVMNRDGSFSLLVLTSLPEKASVIVEVSSPEKTQRHIEIVKDGVFHANPYDILSVSEYTMKVFLNEYSKQDEDFVKAVGENYRMLENLEFDEGEILLFEKEISISN